MGIYYKFVCLSGVLVANQQKGTVTPQVLSGPQNLSNKITFRVTLHQVTTLWNSKEVKFQIAKRKS